MHQGCSFATTIRRTRVQVRKWHGVWLERDARWVICNRFKDAFEKCQTGLQHFSRRDCDWEREGRATGLSHRPSCGYLTCCIWDVLHSHCEKINNNNSPTRRLACPPSRHLWLGPRLFVYRLVSCACYVSLCAATLATADNTAPSNLWEAAQAFLHPDNIREGHGLSASTSHQVESV